MAGGRRHGIEVKLDEAPAPTRSRRSAIEDLSLDHLWVVYTGRHSYRADEKITVWPIQDVAKLPEALRLVRRRRRGR